MHSLTILIIVSFVYLFKMNNFIQQECIKLIKSNSKCM